MRGITGANNYLEEAVGKRENSSGQMAWLHLAIPVIRVWFLLNNNNNGDGMVALSTWPFLPSEHCFTRLILMVMAWWL